MSFTYVFESSFAASLVADKLYNATVDKELLHYFGTDDAALTEAINLAQKEHDIKEPILRFSQINKRPVCR